MLSLRPHGDDFNFSSVFSANGCPVASPSATEPTPPPADEPAAAVEPSAIQLAAVELQAAGFSLVRISRATKRPVDRGWPALSADPLSFGPAHHLGTVCGPRSAPPGYSLVVVDLDTPKAVALADQYLPPTPAVEGRPGKPRSHRFYYVRNESISEEFQSKAELSAGAALRLCGHRGPFLKHFPGPDGKGGIDFIGTGGQVVVPPSTHDSGEKRGWDGGVRATPPPVEFPDLWRAVCELAAESGCRPPALPGNSKRRKKAAATADATTANVEPTADATPAESEDDGSDDATVLYADHADHAESWGMLRYAGLSPHVIAYRKTRAMGWAREIVRRRAEPKSGQSGQTRSHRMMARARYDFDLPLADAKDVFRVINAQCEENKDAWTDDEIDRKFGILEARGPHPDHPIGCALTDPNYDRPPAAWNDPNRLAREYLKRRAIVRVRDQQYGYDGAAYTDLTDERLHSEIRDFCESKAAEQHESEKSKHETAVKKIEKELTEATGKQAPPDLKRAEWNADQQRATDDVKRLTRDSIKLNKATPRVVHVITKKFVGEVVAAVQAQTQQPDGFIVGGWLDEGMSGRYIATANGLLNLDTFELIPLTDRYFTLTALPGVFDPSAPKPERFLTVLNELMEKDRDRIAVVQEVFGACLDAEADFKFFAALVGAGDNGKTVVKNVLGAMLGGRNYSAVNLDTLSSDKFAAYSMYGKLANLIGDQPRFESDDEGKLKALTGGDPVSFERKFRDTFTARNTAKIVFCCNALPTFGDKSDAIWNRLIAVPFDFRVAKPDKALTLASSWTDELPSLLNWAIEGLKRLREQGFTHSDKCEALKHAHRQHSDFTRAFLTGRVEAKTGNALTTKQLYESYREWCGANGYKHPLTSNVFGRVVRAVFPDAKRDVARDGDLTQREWDGLAFKPLPEKPAPPPVTDSGNAVGVQ